MSLIPNAGGCSYAHYLSNSIWLNASTIVYMSEGETKLPCHIRLTFFRGALTELSRIRVRKQTSKQRGAVSTHQPFVKKVLPL